MTTTADYLRRIKSPKPRRGGVVARYGGSIRGRGRDKRAHHDINIDQGVRVEDCATTEKNDIYSHPETSGARRGAFWVQLYGTVMSSAKKNYDVIFLLERII